MTEVMACLFVDFDPSKGNVTLFGDGNCFLVASAVSAWSLQQMLLTVVADGSTRSLHTASYEHHCSRFDIAFHGL